jgi:hypothetical protein
MPRRSPEAEMVQEIITLAEAAECIGVTTQRAYQLACRHQRFPVKVLEGRVVLTDLDKFAEYADRRAAHLVATEGGEP